MNDAHVHFFSTPFFAALGRQLQDAGEGAPDQRALGRLGWDAPGSAEDLADRWVTELDRAHLSRAVLIASVPGDAASVATAVARHPTRFTGYFMVDPTQPDAPELAAATLEAPGMRGICLFPAMHRFPLSDDRVRRIFDVAAAKPGTVIFVHCGVLTVGVRKKLGLRSPFEIRFGNPLDLHALAATYATVPIVIPHFGAGLFRETLMLADLCANVMLDTSSSNGWIKYHHGLTLRGVFEQALTVVGADRLLFGTDSSFFPRGWVRDVFDAQVTALADIGVSTSEREKILGGNFDRLLA